MIYELLCLFVLGGVIRDTSRRGDVILLVGNDQPPAMIYDFPGNKSHEPIIALVSGYNQETNVMSFCPPSEDAGTA